LIEPRRDVREQSLHDQVHQRAVVRQQRSVRAGAHLVDHSQHVRIRLKALRPELGQQRLRQQDAQPTADLGTLLFEVVETTVAVLVETGGEESPLHLAGR
jgi:hypothetical protein